MRRRRWRGRRGCRRRSSSWGDHGHSDDDDDHDDQAFSTSLLNSGTSWRWANTEASRLRWTSRGSTSGLIRWRSWPLQPLWTFACGQVAISTLAWIILNCLSDWGGPAHWEIQDQEDQRRPEPDIWRHDQHERLKLVSKDLKRDPVCNPKNSLDSLVPFSVSGVIQK